MHIKLLLFFFSFLIASCGSVFENEQSTNELIWIEVPSAERQCITPDYSSLEDAVELLQDNNIGVFESKESNFVVCEACGCPTGIVYQALISSSDVEKALELGWRLLDEGDDTSD